MQKLVPCHAFYRPCIMRGAMAITISIVRDLAWLIELAIVKPEWLR